MPFFFVKDMSNLLIHCISFAENDVTSNQASYEGINIMFFASIYLSLEQ